MAEQQMKMERRHIENVLSFVKYDKPTWNWDLQDKGEGYLLRWVFMEKDLTDPNSETLETQKSRKWYISPYMTNSEIIRTAFLAVQQAEMHEIAERFTFMGARIFDPHMNLVALSDNIDKIGVDNRIPIQ